MNKLLLFLFIFLICFKFVTPLSAVVSVPEKYIDVNAGERFYFEVEIKYPENPKRKDLKLLYEIFDEDENLVSQSKALKSIETQVSFIDFIVIPENSKGGLYSIHVNVEDYDKLSVNVSTTFNVSGQKINELQIYFIILLSVVFIIGIFVIFSVRSLRKK